MYSTCPPRSRMRAARCSALEGATILSLKPCTNNIGGALPSTKVIGSMPFRVKRVPDPVASVAGKIEGVISKNELLAQQGVLAKIPDFDFAMNFTVTSFVVSTSKAGFVVDKPTRGNRFSQEQTDLMKGLNPGSRLYIESIVVKGDDGSVRNLPALSFKIN